MADRRTLAEGLLTDNESDRDREEQFVYNKKPHQVRKPVAPQSEASLKAAEEAPAVSPSQPTDPVVPAHAPIAHDVAKSNLYPFLSAARVAIGARVRPELAAALKRTSLERQLSGIEPMEVQGIMEEALELWFHKHGLL